MSKKRAASAALAGIFLCCGTRDENLNPIEVESLIASRDLLWSFEGAEPYFRVSGGDWKRQVTVDPFPAYAHDSTLVLQIANSVASKFPLDRTVVYSLLDREEKARTNGATHINWKYIDDKTRDWCATVVLCGKRIPIMPAMTRYLVSHEYGHVVAQYLRWQVDKTDDDSGKQYAEYAKLRGIEQAQHYGGGTWHERLEEIFANDFRILVTHEEEEFWPHKVARPEGVPAIAEFWKEQTHLAKEKNAAMWTSAPLDAPAGF
jgi:hypothetical protein